MKRKPTFSSFIVRRFAYIVILLTIGPGLLSAETNSINNLHDAATAIRFHLKTMAADTPLTKNTKKQEKEEKNKIKELAKAKKQPKPEKVGDGDKTATSKPKQRPKRQRRPEGIERPPEIPRRNGN